MNDLALISDLAIVLLYCGVIGAGQALALIYAIWATALLKTLWPILLIPALKQ